MSYNYYCILELDFYIKHKLSKWTVVSNKSAKHPSPLAQAAAYGSLHFNNCHPNVEIRFFFLAFLNSVA